MYLAKIVKLNTPFANSKWNHWNFWILELIFTRFWQLNNFTKVSCLKNQIIFRYKVTELQSPFTELPSGLTLILLLGSKLSFLDIFGLVPISSKMSFFVGGVVSFKPKSEFQLVAHVGNSGNRGILTSCVTVSSNGFRPPFFGKEQVTFSENGTKFNPQTLIKTIKILENYHLNWFRTRCPQSILVWKMRNVTKLFGNVY